MRLDLPSSSLAGVVFRSTCCDWLLSGVGQATTDKIAPESRKRVTRFFIVKSMLKVLLLRCNGWNLKGSGDDG